MSHPYERYNERPRRSSFRCLIVSVTIMVWVVLLGLLAARFIVRPMISKAVEQRVAQQVEVSPNSVGTPQEGNISGNVPAGSYTITDVEANRWIAEHRSELKGVDDVRLRFVNDEVQADVTVQGVSSTAHAGVQIIDGKLVVTNPKIDWPLGALVDPKPFAALLQERFNQDLASSERRVTSVTITTGKATINME